MYMIDALLRMRGPVVLIAVGMALVSARASATCRASANGSHSFDSRLSPIAGQVCRMTVAVFAGASCAEPALWQVRLPCDQAQPDRDIEPGTADLDPVAAHEGPGSNVIRITWSAEKFALANLRKLTPKNPPRGEVRLDFDGDGLRLKADSDTGDSVRDRPQVTSIVED